MNDLVAGTIDAMFDSLPSCVPRIRAGRVRVLAICAAQRHALLPDVPTMREAGVARYTAGTWGAVFAPAGMPAPIIARVAEASRATLANPATRDQSARTGSDAEVPPPRRWRPCCGRRSRPGAKWSMTRISRQDVIFTECRCGRTLTNRCGDAVEDTAR